MQNKHTRKWQSSAFSLLLVIAMIFSMLPVSAFAGEPQDPALGTSDTTIGDGGLILTGGEDDPNALLECDCESKCTEEEVNSNCSVCAEHPEWCVVGVEPPGIAAMAAVTGDYILFLNDADGTLRKNDDTGDIVTNDFTGTATVSGRRARESSRSTALTFQPLRHKHFRCPTA